MYDKPLPFTILGRVVGTHTGWDLQDTVALSIYDFKPAEGITIPACYQLDIIYNTGRWEAHNDTDPDPVADGDLLTTLRDIPPTP